MSNKFNEEVRVIGSSVDGWGISVDFSNDYYTHRTEKIGDENVAPVADFSMWSWVNHLREKIWWTPKLEKEFISEVKQKLYGEPVV